MCTYIYIYNTRIFVIYLLNTMLYIYYIVYMIFMRYLNTTDTFTAIGRLSQINFSLLESILYGDHILSLVFSDFPALYLQSPELNSQQKETYSVVIIPQMELNCSRAKSPEHITTNTMTSTV